MTDFLVKRDDLRICRIAESEVPELEPGQARLRVDTGARRQMRTSNHTVVPSCAATPQRLACFSNKKSP